MRRRTEEVAKRTAGIEPSAPAEEPATDRLRAALRAQDLADVSVTFLDPQRVRLGNLKTEQAARRAREVAASVLDPGIVIEVVVLKRPTGPRPAPVVQRREPPATSPPATSGWGVIRGDPAR